MRRAINARSLCRNFLLQGNLRDFCGRRNMSLLLQILISRSRLSSIADTSVAIGCCILVILRNFGHNCLVSLTLIFCFSGFAYLVTCVWHGPQPVRAVFYQFDRDWLLYRQSPAHILWPGAAASENRASCYSPIVIGCFRGSVLRMSEGLHDMGYIQWEMMLCFFAAWLFIFLCLMKGVESLGKVHSFCPCFVSSTSGTN